MTRQDTRDRLVKSATKLFYKHGIRAVSMDSVSDLAGVTKKTLYYHFSSKDELIAEYLSARSQPNLELFKKWFAGESGDISYKTQAVFTGLVTSARSPKWRGCGFLRTTAELADTPGHPAVKIGRAHKKQFEGWLEVQYADARVADPPRLARQVVILLDGAFSTMLLHRDESYIVEAGMAARSLVDAARRDSTRNAEG